MFMLPMISKVCLAYNVTNVDVSLIMLLLKITMTIISKVCLARPGRRRGKLQPSGLECFSGHWKIPIWGRKKKIKFWRVFSDNLYMDHGERNVYLQKKKYPKIDYKKNRQRCFNHLWASDEVNHFMNMDTFSGDIIRGWCRAHLFIITGKSAQPLNCFSW